MDKKIFIITLIILLFLIPSVMAAYATFMHNAIKVSDGKDIDLNGRSIGNGSIIGNVLNSSFLPKTPILYSEAKCDGVTDDYNVIQAEIQNNYTVFLPRGDCIISKELIVINGRGLRLVGTGMGALETPAATGTTIILNSENKTAINITGCVDCVLENFAVNGNNNNTEYVIRLATSVISSSFVNIHIYGARNNTVTMGLIPNSPNGQISEITFYNIRIDAGGLKYNAGITNLKIEGTNTQNIAMYSPVFSNMAGSNTSKNIDLYDGSLYLYEPYFTQIGAPGDDIYIQRSDVRLYIFGGRSESQTEFIYLASGTHDSEVNIFGFVHAAPDSITSLTANNNFLGNISWNGGRSSVLNPTKNFTAINLKTTGITGSFVGNITQVHRESIKTRQLRLVDDSGNFWCVKPYTNGTLYTILGDC